MYDKSPTRWRDVPRHREDVFLPVFKAWVVAELPRRSRPAIGRCLRRGMWGRRTRLPHPYRRIPVQAGGRGGLPAMKPTVPETSPIPEPYVPSPAYDPDYPGYGYDDVIDRMHPVPSRGPDAAIDGAAQPVPVGSGEDPVYEVGKLAPMTSWWSSAREAMTFCSSFAASRVDVARDLPGRSRPSRAGPFQTFPPVDVRKRFAVMPRHRGHDDL